MITEDNLKRQRINWSDIKNAYIYAEPEISEDKGRIRFPSLAEIAEKFGVNNNKLAYYAAKEGWAEQRRSYQKKMRDMHDMEFDMMSLRKSAMTDGNNIARVEQFGRLIDAWLAQNIAECCGENESMTERSESNDDEVTDGIIVNYNEYDVSERREVNMKDLAMAVTTMEKLHKLNRDIMGEPINYYEFYKEKMKEEKRDAEKGKVVNKSDIRDLIASIRGEKANSADITLDVDAEEIGD